MIARREMVEPAPAGHVVGVAKFERLFRVVAELDVDKEDLKRYRDFINEKIHDLLIRGEAAAKAHGRDIIQPYDLPITKGLQEAIQEFKFIDREIELHWILDHLTGRPPLDLATSYDTDERLPDVAGGLSLALARSLKIIDPDLKNPRSEHWQRCYRVLDLLL
jgi:hypothetical protein